MDPEVTEEEVADARQKFSEEMAKRMRAGRVVKVCFELLNCGLELFQNLRFLGPVTRLRGKRSRRE